MKEKLPKILVGCPTYDGHSHCISRFTDGLKNLTYKNFDVLFVDNSQNEDYAKKIRESGYEVVRNPSSKEKIINIVENRNKIIQRAIEKKYDYLFFVDTDVLLPVDAIQKLLSVKQPIASGVYLGGLPIQGETRIAPVLFDFSDKKDYVKIIPLNDVMEEIIFGIAACGFGCCLIEREVLEKVKLRYNEQTKSGEDVLFCADARKNFGYPTFVNTAVKCTHMVLGGDLVFPAGIAAFSFEQEIY